MRLIEIGRWGTVAVVGSGGCRCCRGVHCWAGLRSLRSGPHDCQDGSTDLPPPPHMVATPDGPVPTVDRTKRPLIFESVPSNIPVERWEAKTTAGSSTKPATGNYLYLHSIDRYFSLPDDVKFDKMIDFGTCVPLTPEELPCPVFPLLFYQRGEARIAIDQVGEVFEEIEGGGGDASAFPFFTRKEDQ